MHDELISRQAAGRWVATECNPYGKPTLDFESGKKVIEHLERMPSAQSEHRWIPVTERLPEHFGRYLVTFVPDAGELWTKVDFAMFSDLMGIIKEPIFWNGNVGKADFENVTKNVTAWMPLPEPWKGEGDD